MVVRDIQPYQTVKIGGVTIRLEKKSGQRVRISIDAPKDVPINIEPEDKPKAQ